MNSNAKRLYTITGPNNSKHLVKAASQAQALHAITKDAYKVSAAAAIDVADLISAGVPIIEAGKVPVPEGVPEGV